MAAGGPRANLAGVFQLNTVTRHDGLTRIVNDWEVGSPGFFGKHTPVTLTAFLVKGTAPAKVTGHEQPISNVIHERFTIGADLDPCERRDPASTRGGPVASPPALSERAGLPASVRHADAAVSDNPRPGRRVGCIQ